MAKIPPKYIRVEGKLYRRASPIKKTAQGAAMMVTEMKGHMTEFTQAVRAKDWEEAKANLVEMIGVLTTVGEHIDAKDFHA